MEQGIGRTLTVENLFVITLSSNNAWRNTMVGVHRIMATKDRDMRLLQLNV